jgi:DNA primase
VNDKSEKIFSKIFLKMEIQEIKQRLTLAMVLQHYGLKADKSHRISCPFHEDKTPSMQLYYKTQTAYCFSANCKTHGKSMDVIDFILHKESVGGQPINKHEAIEKAKTMINGVLPEVKELSDSNPKPIIQNPPLNRTQFLGNMFTYFRNAISNSQPAKEYVKNRGLDTTKIEVGYNSGQFHHGARKDETLINNSLQTGLLQDIGITNSRTGDKAYKPFGKGCIVFAMRNKENDITGLYFRSIIDNNTAKHFYLKESTGLYPAYPKPETEILIITESIIDCASLQQLNYFASQENSSLFNVPYSLLAAYGTNRLTEEHKQAIQSLPELKEIIFAFDSDKAGKAATEKYAQELKSQKSKLKITTLELPCKDVNETLQAHEPEVFIQLLGDRKDIFLYSQDIYFSNGVRENASLSSVENKKQSSETLTTSLLEAPPSEGLGRLHTSDKERIIYETTDLIITVWGGIELENLSRLKISLHIQSKQNRYKSFRDDVNLYNYAATQKLISNISEALELPTTTIQQTITDFTEQVEKYRLEERAEQVKTLAPKQYQMTEQEVRAAQAFLSQPDLVKRTIETLSRTGLVGEVRNGLLLYFLYLSRFFDEPLHAIIFGKSGSGKTYLQTKISECLPEESVRTTTSLSENTLYYSPKNFWKNIVLLIEDLDGVYNALLPLREFMSKQSITKLTTDKDSKGNNVQKVLTVEGPICVSGATTKENIYEDNANRSFLIYVDESNTHLNEVMEYQRRAASGNIDQAAQEQAKQQLKNAQRLLTKDIKIINPYAPELRIPDNVFKKLRTNMHYLKLIEIITFYHQHQRPVKQTKQGTKYIETNLQDIYWANHLVKEVLLKKSDELSGELRDFFESLKQTLTRNGQKQTSFFAKDIRKSYRMHPMQLQRHLINLERRGYLQRINANRKTGYEYEVTEWEEYAALQDGINILDTILERLKSKVPS